MYYVYWYLGILQSVEKGDHVLCHAHLVVVLAWISLGPQSIDSGAILARARVRILNAGISSRAANQIDCDCFWNIQLSHDCACFYSPACFSFL